jgi:hypothetical protein
MSVPRGRRCWKVWTFALLVAATALVFVFVSGPGPGAPTGPSAPDAAGSPAPSQPIRVAIDATDVGSMDNDPLFGEDAEIPDRAVDTAIMQVEHALETYLNAQFVTQATRFSEQPLDGLLSRQASAALSDDARAGLGALGISVWQVDSEPVAADARVLTRGDDAALVTVRYDLRAQVSTGDTDPVPLHQQATMVFVPQDGQWRADAIDAVLDLPLPTGGRA